MSIARKLLGYLIFYILPAIFSIIFTMWITTMPDLFAWVYKCSPSNLLCSSIVYSIIFIVGYVIFAFVVGLAWEGLLLIFPKAFGASNVENSDLWGVNSLWTVTREKKDWKKWFIEKIFDVNLQFSMRKEGYEIFIDVKNTNWFVDILKIRFVFQFLDTERKLLSYSFDWLQGCNRNGEVFIGKRKTKTIHFATINQLQRTYDMHFLEGNLNNPFENDRLRIVHVDGLTSNGAKKYLKKDLNGSLLLLERISKGILSFGIENYNKMGAE